MQVNLRHVFMQTVRFRTPQTVDEEDHDDGKEPYSAR